MTGKKSIMLKTFIDNQWIVRKKSLCIIYLDAYKIHYTITCYCVIIVNFYDERVFS